MMGCRNCVRTVIILTVLAPLFSLVVLGVSHNKVVHPGHINSKTAQQVVGHVKKQSNVITDSHGSLLFDPPLLDFGDCAMSVVWRQKVTVKNNRVSDKPINILSISGSSLHFHCSFVEDKVLEASANTTFEVVFLSREEGFVEDTLYIHTNRGSFPYRIQARGMPNPFQAKPFVNVRIPVNTTFSPLIHLYNPFASALQVLEMFGSSCDLHLEMPLVGSDDDPSLDWWLIPPHQSKAIAKVNFLASRAVNVTAFVRIRTNYTAQPHGSLMLPVSLEVTSQPLLFCPQQYLDFGVVDVLDAPRTLKLFVINSGNRPITVQSVTASPLVDGLSIELSAGVKVAPSLTTPTLVALVTLRPGRVSQLRTTSGRIVVQSKNGLLKATVGYHWTVAASYLHYNRTSTQFLATSQPQLPNCRPLTVSNDFALAVDVLNATLSANAGRYVEIRQFERRVLRTREQGTILDLCLVKMPPLQTPFVTQLTLRTNTSARLDIPVSVFTGRMTPIWKDNDDNETLGGNETDRFVGWLTHGSSKELYMALWNGNPEGVGISLLGWGTNNTNAVLTYLGSESASSPAQFKSRSNNYYGSNLTMATTVRPGSYAVFQVLIHGQDDDENNQVALLIHVRTAYETLAVTLRYRTMAGSIRTIPEPLPWSAHFLDPHLTTEVRLNSTLQTPVTVLGFRAPPSLQHKLSFDLYSGGIRAMQSAGIARLAYPLDWHCAQSPLAKLGGSRWNGAADFESTTALYGCYESLVQSLWSQVASVKLVTKEIGFTDMPLRLDVQWPRLAVKRRLHFPLTEMGRRSQVELKLVNPTSNVILAHVVRLDNEDALRELVAKLPSHLTEGIELPSRVQQQQQQQQQPRRSPSPFSLHADATGREDDDETDVMVYLTPGSQAILTVSFRPMADLKYRSLLAVKNNVTGLELVSVSGQGQSAKFLLANRKPGSNQPLLFDIGEQHLKNCLVGGANSGGTTTSNSNRFHYLLPSVTVKRTFTARNRGQFPITITGFDINHSPCEGYGFRVLQCQPLTLLPNESHSLEVAFTPDFTQTRVSRTLRIHSTLGGQQTPLNYTLTATLPDHMLVPCAAVLPRPNWESIFYYASVVVSVFLLLCVITAAALDADRILKTGVVAVVTVVSAQSVPDTEPRGHLLDLRAIGKEAAMLPSSSNWSDINNCGTTSSTESNCSSSKAKSNNNSSKKSKSKKTQQQRPASKGPASTPLSSTGWILSPPSKRTTTPSPTMSSSSVQTPPPSPKPFRYQPPSPTPKALPPPVIVTTNITTTKEETRVFVKPKAKKVTKATTKTTPSLPITVAPSVPVPVPVTAPTVKASEPSSSPSTTTKRARSSSVPSNNRKKAPPEVQVPATPRSTTVTVTPTIKPTGTAATIKIPVQASAASSVTAPPPPPPPPPPPSAALEKEDSVWNKKARLQPKVVATVAAIPTTITTTTTTAASSTPIVQQQQQQQPPTVRPQPPVGKILPEVRRPEIVQQQQQQETPLKADHELPKPIGYRPSLATTSNAQANQWFNLLPSSPPAAVVPESPVAPVVPTAVAVPTTDVSMNWWPEDHSLFSLNRPQQQPAAIEEQRDWFGLRSLASDLTSNNNNSSSSSTNDQPTSWPNWPSQQQQLPQNSFSLAPAVPPTSSSSSNSSRIYSPWSVPHWLQVTQQPQQQQQQSDSAPGSSDKGGESWPAYSQF